MLIFVINMCLGQWEPDSLIFDISEDDSLIFSTYPKNLHFYARNTENNLCTIELTGEKPASSAEILIEIYKDSTLYFDETISEPNFALNFDINAGMHSYDLVVYFEADNGEWEQLYEATDIICGDVFIIQGQSNAVAWEGWFPEFNSNELINPFIRSYGKTWFYTPNELNNKEFAIAVADSFNTHGFIGI